jgi:hypothetical protein
VTHATLGPCLTGQESRADRAILTNSPNSSLTLQPERAMINLLHQCGRRKIQPLWRSAAWAASREGRRARNECVPKSERGSLGRLRRRAGRKMTAEVAVLNKFGLALAADSAVTVDHWHEKQKHTKVYNTANKLFTLSKFEPVGIMYYNTVTLGGVPWETIIKVYRKELGRQKFDTIEQYADHFFKWLSVGTIFTKNMLTDIVETTIIRAFVDLIHDKKSKDDFRSEFDKKLDELRKKPDVPGFDDAFRARIAKEYKKKIDECIAACFKKASYITGIRAAVIEYVTLILSKKEELSGYSGIVIAGFGDKEALPRLREYTVDLVVLDKVRVWLKSKSEINENTQSVVVPLADAEVIRTLIEGISPNFVAATMLGAVSLIIGLPKKILDPVVELTDSQKQKYIADAEATLPAQFKEYAEKMREHRRTKYTQPIRQAIASLSLSDLGMVEETFVAASQLLKRVRPELESVGGPVDVAVISKGDGFIWTKRKLYFEDRMNPAFRLKYLEQ